MKPADVFVGRKSEMAALNAALDGAIAGQGKLLMLVGEPGIGKTRIAEELATTAVQKGADVLWGRCREERGAPPLWPWTQIMRALLDLPGTGSSAAELRSSAELVLRTLPGQRQGSGPTAQERPGQDLQTSRFQLYGHLRRAGVDRHRHKDS